MSTKQIDLRKHLFHTLIILLPMFLIKYLPTFGSVTPLGMEILGIFVGCCIGWITGHFIWPSLLGIVLLGLTDYGTVDSLIVTTYGNSTLWMAIFCLVFIAAIESCGIIDVATKYLLSRKFIKKGPWVLAAAFWGISYLLGIFITAVVVALILWAFFEKICEQLNLKPYQKYPTIVIIGIAAFSDLGMTTAPFAANLMICLGVFQSVMPDTTVNLTAYSLTLLSTSLISILVVVLLCKYILCRNVKMDLSSVQVVDAQEKLSLTTHQKIVMAYTLLLLIVFIAPTILPAEWGIIQLLNNVGYAGRVILILILMSITLNKGTPIIDIDYGMRNNVLWNLIFMMGCAWTLAAALADDAVGVVPTIVDFFEPFFAGKSASIFVILVLFCGMVMTNFINNSVCFSIVIPLAMSFAPIANVNPVALFTLLVPTLTVGIVLPSGSPLGAVVHGYTAWIKSYDAMRYGAFYVITFMLISGIIGYPLGGAIISMLG